MATHNRGNWAGLVVIIACYFKALDNDNFLGTIIIIITTPFKLFSG